MASSSARLVGVFIRPGVRMARPLTAATITITSIREFKLGAPEPTTVCLVTTAGVPDTVRATRAALLLAAQGWVFSMVDSIVPVLADSMVWVVSTVGVGGFHGGSVGGGQK